MKLDLAALKEAAERPDSSHAVVARRWLGDIYLALSGAADIEIVPPRRVANATEVSP